jgi:hypothetical protein
MSQTQQAGGRSAVDRGVRAFVPRLGGSAGSAGWGYGGPIHLSGVESMGIVQDRWGLRGYGEPSARPYLLADQIAILYTSVLTNTIDRQKEALINGH